MAVGPDGVKVGVVVAAEAAAGAAAETTGDGSLMYTTVGGKI